MQDLPVKSLSSMIITRLKVDKFIDMNDCWRFFEQEVASANLEAGNWAKYNIYLCMAAGALRDLML